MTGFADVAVPLGVRKIFAYSIPRELEDRAGIGTRVLVPFGRKVVAGFVVGRGTDPPSGEFKIRPLRAVIDREPVIPEELVDLALWVSRYYFTPPGEVLRALLPSGSAGEGSRRVRLSPRIRVLIEGGLRPPGLNTKEERLLQLLSGAGEITLKALCAQDGLKDASQWIDACAERGWVEIEDVAERGRVAEKTQLAIVARAADPESILGLSGRQRDLYLALQSAGEPLRLQAALRLTGAGMGAARALEKKGLAAIAPLRIDRIPLELADAIPRKELTFTRAQAEAFARLREWVRECECRRCLLYGVTGSGKTEIYLRLIAEVLAMGGGAMLLVPEIGLTPMLSRIAASHFPEQVALLHSGMASGERFDQWHRIRTGAARVVVGTRSAVFAPLDNLRLIVIDEEQDASYKQDESPCYHAREVAWQRLRRRGGLLLLGSATPAVETYHIAQAGSEMACLTLPERIEARPLPEVQIVDMSVEFQRHGRKTVISERLRGELVETLRRGEQSIVLLNRRGYSRSLLCRSCGNVFTCPDCSISMTYHQSEGNLACHYCGREQAIPSACSACGGEYIYFVGVGTEQLEELLRGLLPKARLARVDRDTTRKRGALRKILLDFSERKLDLLVGTQILAKGHDFPDVTLVGVVSADSGLSFPDFRSAERTFQLLTQVAGRAGRGQVPGRVVIQSFYPDHYALQFARRQDYPGFYRHEIEFRDMLGYPPYRSLVQIVVRAVGQDKGRRIGETVAAELRESVTRHDATRRIQVLGPAAAPLEKLRGEYRFQVLLKTDPGEDVGRILEDAFARLGQRRIPIKNMQVDVDPLTLL